MRGIQEKTLTRIGGSKEVWVDFRLIAATNRDLAEAVAAGRFREDLFYRLNVIPIHIPALRDRPNDILPLLMHFLKLANDKYGMDKNLSSSCLKPGSARAVQTLLKRLVATAAGETICSEQLPVKPQSLPAAVEFGGGTLDGAKERLEAELVRRAYARHHTCIGVAAELGISHASATRKLRKHMPGS